MITDLFPGGTASSALAHPKVLYVEDQEINVLVMQALMALRPHIHLLIATNGEDGCRTALDEQPDLLLLDLRLPDCHGTQLLQRMREMPALADIPAVAVTADVATDIAGTGFLELWPKPLHVPDTLAALDRLLGSTRPDRDDPGQPAVESAFGRFESGKALRRSIEQSVSLMAAPRMA